MSISEGFYMIVKWLIHSLGGSSPLCVQS